MSIMNHVNEAIAAEVKRQLEPLLARLEKLENHLSPEKNDSQLAIIPTMNELSRKIDNMEENVYERIMTDINRDVVPQINKAMQWVNYNLQDGGEIADEYRRAVEQQNGIDPDVLLLTDGVVDKRVISAHVRTFFGGPDEDSSSSSSSD